MTELTPKKPHLISQNISGPVLFILVCSQIFTFNFSKGSFADKQEISSSQLDFIPELNLQD
jgi:hypothetical protein